MPEPLTGLHGMRAHGDNCIHLLEKLCNHRSLTSMQLAAITGLPIKAVTSSLVRMEKRYLVRRYGTGYLSKSTFSLREYYSP